MISVPEAAAGDEHLRILALLSRKLMDADFRARLQGAEDKAAILGARRDPLGGAVSGRPVTCERARGPPTWLGGPVEPLGAVAAARRQWPASARRAGPPRLRLGSVPAAAAASL